MPSLKRPHSHISAFADLEDDPVRVDYDPEDDAAYSSAASASASDSGLEDEPATDLKAGREHYAPTSRSALRQRETHALGPQYAGSRVSRNGIVAEDGVEGHDPFEDGSGSEDDDAQDDRDLGSEEDSEEGNADLSDGGDTDATSLSEDMMDGSSVGSSESDKQDDDDDNDEDRPRTSALKDPLDRTALRQLMSREQKIVSADLSAAHAADVRKGRAVKRQRRTYDALLNARIRMQTGLVAVNSLSQASGATSPAEAQDANGVEDGTEAYEAAYEAALSLWNSLDSLRVTFSTSSLSSNTKDSTKSPTHTPATSNTPLKVLWARTSAQSGATAASPNVTSTLRKWSHKTASLSTATRGKLTSSTTGESRLNPSSAGQTTLFDILQTQHLSAGNIDRLVARTQIPRSCAPVQAAKGLSSDAGVYDDADFYGQLLKELLESRNVETTSANLSMGRDGGHDGNEAENRYQSGLGSDMAAAEAAYRSAQRAGKVKKQVDTKASKGRKLRFTVHEKLQNFMAPEDRSTWGERQKDDLFGSLLGQRLRIDDQRDSGGVQVNRDAGMGDEAMQEEEALRLFRN